MSRGWRVLSLLSGERKGNGFLFKKRRTKEWWRIHLHLTAVRRWRTSFALSIIRPFYRISNISSRSGTSVQSVISRSTKVRTKDTNSDSTTEEGEIEDARVHLELQFPQSSRYRDGPFTWWLRTIWIGLFRKVQLELIQFLFQTITQKSKWTCAAPVV